jgi:hypothetical protein
MMIPVPVIKNHHTLLLPALALAVLLGSCTWNRGVAQLHENDQVTFLVLTEMIDLMEGERITRDSVGRVYCVSVSTLDRTSFRAMDPSDDLLHALREAWASVTRASSCKLDPESGFLEAIDLKVAILVWADKPERLSGENVVVEAGYFIEHHDQAVFDCSLVFSGGEWGVQDCRLKWIS